MFALVVAAATVGAIGAGVAVVLAGGYAMDVADTVDIHAATIEALLH